MKTAILGAAAILFAGSVSAQTIRFSTDANNGPNAPSFIRGTEVARGLGSGDLTVDFVDSPSSSMSFGMSFFANLNLSPGQSTPLGGGLTLHHYAVNGTFGFNDLLTATVTDAVFTSIGTADNWGSTATIQGNSLTGSVVYDWSGPAIPEFGLTPGTYDGGTGFAFALSLLSHGNTFDPAAPGMPLLPGTRLPDTTNGRWYSQTLFDGFLTVPSPASSVTLAGLALFAVRRRR